MSDTKIDNKISSFIEEKILNDDIEKIFGERFGRYSKYIIQERALPDVRDGLKPVQRRILFAMYKVGMFFNKPYKKSARIVGEVIGKYHPHGDTSVYDALIRMSQNFVTLLPLIDVHGNNGSIDGDPPAAMRYTEARLSIYADYLLKDINKHTVGFVPNFDDEELEPVVLPAKFPNILVNGATGIAVGMATKIPPHNVTEILNAVIYRINNPESTLNDIMNIVQGPDFPTGGIVQGIDAIREAYQTGVGKIIVKARTEIVQLNNKKQQIVISEIPYEVNKAQLVKRMSDVVTEKNVDGVLDIRDESDRQGLRIVIELTPEANAEFIRNFFFKTTDLQINYAFNMVVIHDKKPCLLGLVDILDAYIEHQKDVITNRSNYELVATKKRLHIVDGLISMVSILDAVIKTIRSSANKKDARDNLVINYKFTEEQAEAIVMLQLYRLTNTDIVALMAEKKELEAKIEELTEILNNDQVLLDTVKKEALETLQAIQMERKTTIEHKIDTEVKNITTTAVIPKEDVVILITHDGYIKRLAPKNYDPSEDSKMKENDFETYKLDCTTVDTLLLFTNEGNYVYLPINNIPEVKMKDMGANVSVLAHIADTEKIVFATCVSNFDDDKYVLITTKNGLTKRTLIKDLDAMRISKALKATKVREDDEIVSIDICEGDKKDVVVVTKEGFILRYESKEISIFAPASFGVKAIELKNRPNDEVLGAYYVDPKDVLLILNNKGGLRKFKLNDIVKGRKIHVGKLYFDVQRGTQLIDFDILHKNNIDAETILSGDSGEMKFNALEEAKPLASKKIGTVSVNVGTPRELIVVRNNGDYE